MDFGKENDGIANLHEMYPPNFTVLVDGQKAVQDSLAVFELKGTLPTSLVYEEPLSQSHAFDRSGMFFVCRPADFAQ